MARISVVLIRQLIGNHSNPCADLLHLRKLFSNSIRTLALNSTPSSPKAIIPSTSKPLSFSLHSPNLHFLKSRCLSSPSAGSDIIFSSPLETGFISTKTAYLRAVKQVKDGLLPSVFYFTMPFCLPFPEISPTIRKLREQFPHVIIYVADMYKPGKHFRFVLEKMNVDRAPTFHFYQNGRKVDEIVGIFESRSRLEDTFAKLYKYVIPVETTQLTSSSGIGERRTQQLVKQAKEDENGIGVVGGSKVGLDAARPHPLKRALARQLKIILESVEEARKNGSSITVGGWGRGEYAGAGKPPRQSRSRTVPPLCQVMDAVKSLYRMDQSSLKWFAKGLFKSKPEKRDMFVRDPHWRLPWVRNKMVEE